MKVLAAVAVAGLVACGCAGCSSHSDFCAPPELAVTPKEAPPGGTATLAAGSGDCDAGADRTYRVAVQGGGRELPVGTATPAPDGAFRLSFTVPSVAPGEYDVVVRGSTLDDCTDSEGSCAQYSTLLKVTS